MSSFTNLLKNLYQHFKTDPYKNCKVIANCNIQYNPNPSVSEFEKGMMRRLTGIYPLIIKNGEYFIARGMKPDPSLKTINGHVDDHIETIHFALEDSVGNKYQDYEHVWIDSNDRLGIPACQVSFI